MTAKNKIKTKINTDSDFIYCPRLNNSLSKYVERYPEGVDNEKIAKVLMMDEDEVEATFQRAVKKLRDHIGLESMDEDDNDDE